MAETFCYSILEAFECGTFIPISCMFYRFPRSESLDLPRDFCHGGTTTDNGYTTTMTKGDDDDDEGDYIGGGDDGNILLLLLLLLLRL